MSSEAAGTERVPDNPFDSRAEWKARTEGWPIERGRDYVILEGLRMGDPDPLAHFLLYGHIPGVNTRRFLARMLHPISAPESEAVVPFALVPKSRRPGKRPRKLERIERDRLLQENVARAIAELGRGSYEAVVKTVAEKTAIGEQTVRDAYDRTRTPRPLR
jgi:hypothetical protein